MALGWLQCEEGVSAAWCGWGGSPGVFSWTLPLTLQMDPTLSGPGLPHRLAYTDHSPGLLCLWFTQGETPAKDQKKRGQREVGYSTPRLSALDLGIYHPRGEALNPGLLVLSGGLCLSFSPRFKQLPSPLLSPSFPFRPCVT